MEPYTGTEEFGAKVFKISRDDKGERLTFLKVTGGKLVVKMPVNLVDKEEKVNQIRIYSGAKYETVMRWGPEVSVRLQDWFLYIGQGFVWKKVR